MTFYLGRVRVRVEFWFLLLLCLFLLLDRQGFFPLILTTILLHEGSHLLMMGLVGQPVRSVTFAPYGVGVERSPCPGLSKWREMAVYAAGPAGNLLVFLLVRLFAPHRFLWDLFGVMNLVVGGFNLLPIQSLDGGCLLRTLLAGRGARMGLLSTAVSALVLIPLFALGFVLFFRGGNISLLLTCFYLAALVVAG